MYAVLICPESKECIWLGKVLENDATRLPILFDGYNVEADVSKNVPMMRAVVTFLLKHRGREIRVINDLEIDDICRDDWTIVTADGLAGLSFAEYSCDYFRCIPIMTHRGQVFPPN